MERTRPPKQSNVHVERTSPGRSDATGAAAAYVAMTRGRHDNTAHLVAENIEDARKQWVEVFSRDRADLGPAHAKQQALDAVDRYGTKRRRRPAQPLPESRRQTLYGEFGSRGGIGI